MLSEPVEYRVKVKNKLCRVFVQECEFDDLIGSKENYSETAHFEFMNLADLFWVIGKSEGFPVEKDVFELLSHLQVMHVTDSSNVDEYYLVSMLHLKGEWREGDWVYPWSKYNDFTRQYKTPLFRISSAEIYGARKVEEGALFQYIFQSVKCGEFEIDESMGETYDLIKRVALIALVKS